ncbi:hypothetical protein Rhe02_19310 [Rhizocola hellebori]|uniref:Uncharacterized protein n=1 Tax=Rhizocola hellebori TaxID=1392758 RepID=A0A8J3VDU4_9ACTN|nr:hypothetical protein [Rhizocola hellebori]GIH03864.1 hypothetical protein Rhe02_19310 [Rhizocola hellebori]
MPTEAEFLVARDAFRAAAETARRPVTPMLAAFGPQVLVGGLLTAETSELLSGHSGQMRSLADRWDRLADECAWRARVCAAAYAARAAYAAAFGAYESDHDSWEADRDRAAANEEAFTRSEPHPPQRPPSPPPWVRWP